MFCAIHASKRPTGTSRGGVESLIELRASSEGKASNAPQNLLRVSVGLKHPDDLIQDLLQALGLAEGEFPSEKMTHLKRLWMGGRSFDYVWQPQKNAQQSESDDVMMSH
jgi:hypothetical protein